MAPNHHRPAESSTRKCAESSTPQVFGRSWATKTSHEQRVGCGSRAGDMRSGGVGRRLQHRIPMGLDPYLLIQRRQHRIALSTLAETQLR